MGAEPTKKKRKKEKKKKMPESSSATPDVRIERNELFIENDVIALLSELSMNELVFVFCELREEYERTSIIQAYKLVERWLYGKLEVLYRLFLDKGYFHDTIEEEKPNLLPLLKLDETQLFKYNCQFFILFAECHPGQVNHFWSYVDTLIKFRLNEISSMIF